MAKIKNVSGQDLIVPALGRLVLNGQVIEVRDDQVYRLTAQSIWEASDKAAKDIHIAAEAPEPDGD